MFTVLIVAAGLFLFLFTLNLCGQGDTDTGKTQASEDP